MAATSAALPDIEKAAFGNEVDFFGDPVGELTAVGFHVYTTGENNARANPNMPSIAIEVDPNLASSASNFSTLTFVPTSNSGPNDWSDYIDATTTGLWGGTGPAFAGTPCDLNGARCTFEALQASLDDADGNPATILTVGITKGRDFPWQGAVDGLRINDTIYDFEETGVFETAPSTESYRIHKLAPPLPPSGTLVFSV